MTRTWPKLDWFWKVFAAPDAAEPWERKRVHFIERNVGLPVRAAYLGILLYYLFFALNDADIKDTGEMSMEALVMIRSFFLAYFLLNFAMGFLLWGMDQFPLRLIQYLVFAMGLVDVLFLALLTVIDEGFKSNMYWIYPGLIIRNAASIPNAGFQILLNLFVCLCYLLAGVLDLTIKEFDEIPLTDEYAPESFILKVVVLLLLAAWVYALQLLLEKQQLAEADAQEFSLRQEQLRSMGRLAAEVAHQLKNPLGIINNASFTLQKHLNGEDPLLRQQVEIIRDEITKSDWILTELMGYSKLMEGRVERVYVTDEIDRAIQQVFPEGVATHIQIHRDYARALPALLIQRSHLEEIFVNLLQNAREAMNDRGNIWVSANYGEGYMVVIKFRDDGPGIAPECRDRIFEAYFTTKEHGTGLGMPIIKNNVEMYGGTVEVESAPGQGTEFTLRFPGKTALQLHK